MHTQRLYRIALTAMATAFGIVLAAAATVILCDGPTGPTSAYAGGILVFGALCAIGAASLNRHQQ